MREIKLAKVYHLKNNRILAFDDDRNLMFDAVFEDIVDAVTKASGPCTRFFVQGYSLPVDREAFRSKEIWNLRKRR